MGVIPAEAGIQGFFFVFLDSRSLLKACRDRFHGNDTQ